MAQAPAQSPQTQESHDEQHNDNKADDINYSVHRTPACLRDQRMAN